MKRTQKRSKSLFGIFFVENDVMSKLFLVTAATMTTT